MPEAHCALGSAWSQATTPSSPRDLRGTIESVPRVLRLCCTTRRMPFVQSIFPHPQPPSASGAETPKIFLLSASGNVRNPDLRHVTILYTAPPPRPAAIPAFVGQKGSPRLRRPAPTPPRATHRLPRTPGRRLSALCAYIFPKPFSTRRRPYPRVHPAAQANQLPCQASRGTRPIFPRLQQTPDKLLTFL
jgi:hypothetical protein